MIKISGHGDKKRFTVRKISDGIGVERIFPMESPFIESVTVNKYGRVRRAKLYYLRNLTGRKAGILQVRKPVSKSASSRNPTSNRTFLDTDTHRSGPQRGRTSLFRGAV